MTTTLPTVDEKLSRAEICNKTMRFPQADSFAELFDGVSAIKAEAAAPHVEHSNGEVMTLDNWILIQDAGGNNRYNLYGQLKQEVMESLGLVFIDNDSLYYEVIKYDNGTALVTIKHNRIIGSRWISIIDSNTIPTIPQ